MPNKRPTNFEKRLHSAEQRAKRKLKRLENKGVRITGINPIQDMSTLTTGQRRSYENKLEKFIARQNRIVAGYQGTPIHWSTVQQIRKAESTLNKQRAKEWAKVSGQPVLTKGSSMTANGMRDMGRIYDMKSGTFSPNPKSNLYSTEARRMDISQIKSDKSAKEYVKQLKHHGTKNYIQYKNKIMINNMVDVINSINEPELAKRIKKLTLEQIYILSARSDFIQSVFMNSGNDGVGVVRGIVTHIEDTLDALEAKEL